MDGKLPYHLPGPVTWDDIPIPMILTDKEGVVWGWNKWAEGVKRGEKGLFHLESNPMCLSFPFARGDFRGTLILHLEGKTAEGMREAMKVAADLAHEIRNPLGSIELFASLLKKSLTRETDLRRVDHITQAVRLINERITGLLDSLKKKSVHRGVVFLKRLIADIVGPAELCETFLSFKVVSEEVEIVGDENLLRHLFLTLIIGLLSNIPANARLEISLNKRREADKAFGEVTFICTVGDGESKVAWTDIIQSLNFPLLHHVVKLHDGIMKLDVQSISIALPVRT